ncbi:MAG: Ig-like domain repeat protein, partial [Pyrinomonadaceae bacterium]
MRMLPPTRQRSVLRSLTTPTNHPVRLIALIAFVALAGAAFAANKSSANSLGRTLFAKAAEMIAPAKAAHADHALAAAELETSSSTMATERRGHTATRLADGRVLIAGGENASGPLNTAEIYDPVAATFSTSGNMNEARADHSATLLADGRVLIMGGRNAAGGLASTEIFDPVTGAFTSGPTMSAARADHTATLLADGRVFVAGGNNAEILNAALSAFTSAGTLNTARTMHSAALLADGRVVLVGGRDAGNNELATGEIFDTPAGSFSPIAGALKVARVRPHLRVMFDGKVQIIGGNNDRSMEIYDPLYESFGAYAHVIPESDPCTGLAAQILASQTRAALFHNAQTDPLFDRSGHTITELNGQALVIGGANSSGTVLNSSSLVGSSSAAISTDKMDYEPGEIAHISGRGFQPGETVRLKIHEDPHTPQERGFEVVADSTGNFSGEYVVMDYDLNMKFIAGARGLTSGKTAQTTFTDSNNFNVTPLSQSVAAGSTNTFAWVFTATNSGNQQTTTFTVPAGWTTPQVAAGPGQVTVAGSGASPCNVSLQSIAGMVITIRQSPPSPATGTCTNGTSFTLTYANATAPTPAATTTYTFDNQHGQDPQVIVTANANVATTLMLAAPSPASVAFGSTGPVTLSATLTRTTGGAAVAGATIDFTVDGTSVGTGVTNGSGVATFSYNPSALTAGPHTVQASFAGEVISGTTYTSSTSGTQTLTVNKRDTLTTVSSSLNPSAFGESVSFTATVAGTGAGAGNPSGGSVQFKIDGANFGAPVALAGGSASSGSISTLTAGSHTIEAFFTSTDTNFNDSNDSLDGGQTVNKRDTLTTVSSSLNPSTFGESVSFTATVAGTGAGTGNPSGGTVQFKIDGANFGAPVALAGGSASSGSISTLTAGNHTVEALFTSADTNFNDSNDSLDGGQTVNKRDTLTTVSSSLNPSTFGESVSFTATVVGTGAGAGNPSGGTVQFKIDGANFGAPVALAGGSASSGSISTLTAGNHTVEALFTSADTNFNDSNDTLDGGQTVNKRDTQTTVSSSLNPSTFGESVSFTATVVGTGAGAGNPSGGSVQFKIDGANFGAPVALTGGSANSGSISTLTAGNHTVEAFFTSADTNFNDS